MAEEPRRLVRNTEHALELVRANSALTACTGAECRGPAELVGEPHLREHEARAARHSRGQVLLLVHHDAPNRGAPGDLERGEQGRVAARAPARRSTYSRSAASRSGPSGTKSRTSIVRPFAGFGAARSLYRIMTNRPWRARGLARSDPSPPQRTRPQESPVIDGAGIHLVEQTEPDRVLPCGAVERPGMATCPKVMAPVQAVSFMTIGGGRNCKTPIDYNNSRVIITTG